MLKWRGIANTMRDLSSQSDYAEHHPMVWYKLKAFSWGQSRHVTHFDQSQARKNVWWVKKGARPSRGSVQPKEYFNSNSLLTLMFGLFRTYLNTNMIVPFARCTQAFLLIDTSLCILVSIEFIMKVSGTQSLSVASPLRIMVWLMPNPSRGSRQNCPMYKSTENSWG